ncbi:hypothetical protein BGZ57DRAFT_314645 [Hyaloscypha finlandica]|nr:hypothetical protein BGZ57DRAFT_314645 [Hyaloscypha finlandica]
MQNSSSIIHVQFKNKQKPKAQANGASWTPPEGGGPPPPHSSSSSSSQSNKSPPSTPSSPHSSSSSLSSPLSSSSISSPPPSTLLATNAAFAAANSRLISNLNFWASTRCFRSRFFSCRLIFFFGAALAAARRASIAAIWARSVGEMREGSSRVVGAGGGGIGAGGGGIGVAVERAVHPLAIHPCARSTNHPHKDVFVKYSNFHRTRVI